MAFISVRAANAVTRTYATFWNHHSSHSALGYDLRICFVIYDTTYFGWNAILVYYVIVIIH